MGIYCNLLMDLQFLTNTMTSFKYMVLGLFLNSFFLTFANLGLGGSFSSLLWVTRSFTFPECHEILSPLCSQDNSWKMSQIVLLYERKFVILVCEELRCGVCPASVCDYFLHLAFKPSVKYTILFKEFLKNFLPPPHYFRPREHFNLLNINLI